jgi:uncharacterized membrane protein YqaE (UPF0057 family)
MKRIFFLMFLLAGCLCMPAASFAAIGPQSAPQTESRISAERAEARAARQEKKAARQSMREQLRKAMAAADEELVLLIILALLLPPLAMYLYEGDFTTRFWISLALTLLGAGLIIGWSGIGYLPAVAYTLYVILAGI